MVHKIIQYFSQYTNIQNISDNSLNPFINYYNKQNIRVKFTRSCLKRSTVSYTHGTIVKIYIVCELCASSSNDNDPTLKNCLFGAATLTKNADIDKSDYSGYGIGFDRRSRFSFPGGGFGQNVIIFGVDMSPSTNIDNRKKRHFNSWKWTNSRIKTYTLCRKNVLN